MQIGFFFVNHFFLTFQKTLFAQQTDTVIFLQEALNAHQTHAIFQEAMSIFRLSHTIFIEEALLVHQTNTFSRSLYFLIKQILIFKEALYNHGGRFSRRPYATDKFSTFTFLYLRRCCISCYFSERKIA